MDFEFDEEALLAQIMESVNQTKADPTTPKTETKESLETTSELVNPAEATTDSNLDVEDALIKTVCPAVGQEIFWELSNAFYKKVFQAFF